MIRTRIVELIPTETIAIERELGFCLFPEIPVEKKAPPKDPTEAPLTVKVNGKDYFIISHTWDISAVRNGHDASDATLVLLVMAISAPVIDTSKPKLVV